MRNLDVLIKRAGVYSSWLADKLESIQNDPSSDIKRKQPKLVVHQMRDYQIAGMEWLISMYDNGLNGILADEMGCGKTLQTLAFLAYLREMGTTGPFLIVAPLSTLSNWIAESEKFTPSVPIVSYHGTPAERQAIRQKSFKLKKGFPIIVTSYEICMKDRKSLGLIAWKYIIIDEGHRLKNLDCKLIRELKKYQSANRLLLTGTPLQNNLSELWSLLNFLMPEIFADLQEFEDWFEFAGDRGDAEEGQEFIDKDAVLVSKLHEILRPFVLRRLKNQVVKELPQKLEYVIYAPLVPKQKELYQAALKGRLPLAIAANIQYFYDQFKYIDPTDDLDEIENVTSDEDESSIDQSLAKKQKLLSETKNWEHESNKTAGHDKHVKRIVGSQNLLSTVVQLRKICNHPLLFRLIDEDLMLQSKFFQPMLNWSGKMILLDQILTALIKRGHKVLIFSQMTKMLDIIADYCDHVKNFKYGRIDGHVKPAERKQDIDEFNNNPDIPIFLLSTRAGGLGVNLVAADTVIIYDSDWNPQVDLQAQDRAHRIGQTKKVAVYRFVTAGSIESNILSKQSSKRKLEKLVMHKDQFKGNQDYYESTIQLSAQELRDIMEYDENTQVYTDGILSKQELDRILDRDAVQENTEQ